MAENEQTHEEDQFMNSAPAHNSDAVRHLYVHFPFCARICPYCAFYKTRGNSADFAAFCDALAIEAKCASEKISLDLDTLFWGGGTPTALSTDHLATLMRSFAQTFDLRRLTEWTIEANPGSVSAKKAAVLRRAGITRISLGIQSWEDDLLCLLGREHDARQAEESFRIFRDAGFENISVDLMFALPGQTESQWRASLERTIALKPEHISTYCLTYEEDTEFLARFELGEFRAQDEIEARFFELAMAMLEAAGYQHYEISNYARPGFQSRHNEAYWRGEDYIGLGPSAFSTRKNERWQNIADHREYARRLSAGESPIASTEMLTTEMKRAEQIALGLRSYQGVAADLLAASNAKALLEAGLVAYRKGRVVLTQAGKLVADSVAEELL
ncbi:MAG: coproporphyrinogen III oxidase [Verrucomicrobia bacterium]|nr:MAG: coproporphyrinogen III oxidase [Verrucomicrobiota bacterium]